VVTIPDPTTTSTSTATTVATCKDIRTGEQTTDAERCTLPVTGNDETEIMAFGACIMTGLGLTLLFARRGRPDHRGNVG
jgi:LPXTG-motif cell wall-anchored protein